AFVVHADDAFEPSPGQLLKSGSKVFLIFCILFQLITFVATDVEIGFFAFIGINLGVFLAVIGPRLCLAAVMHLWFLSRSVEQKEAWALQSDRASLRRSLSYAWQCTPMEKCCLAEIPEPVLALACDLAEALPVTLEVHSIKIKSDQKKTIEAGD